MAKNIIKKIKIKKQDGTFTDYIPIGANAENINIDYNDSDLETTIGKKPYYYNSVADMKADISLKIGDMVITLGYYEANDGGGAEYKITEVENLINYQEELENGLYATLIINDTVNVKKIGIIGNNSSNSIRLNDFILKYNKNIFFPTDYYYFTEPIIMKPRISIFGDFPSDYGLNHVYNSTSLHFQTSGFINCDKNSFKNLSIYGSNNTTNNIYGIARANTGNAIRVDDCNIFNFYVGIYGNERSILVSNSIIKLCNIGILNCTDSKIINNTIGSNTSAIKLYGQGDNIISENRIEWNDEYGIYSTQGWHLEVCNNLIDRNGYQGIFVTNMSVVNIIGNLLRRNFASNSEYASNRAHIYVSGNINININSNNTDNNHIIDGDITSDITPSVGLYFVENRNINIVGNNFSGVTLKPYISGNYAQKFYLADYTTAKQSANTGRLNPNSSINITFPIYYIQDQSNYAIKYQIQGLVRDLSTDSLLHFDKSIYYYNGAIEGGNINSDNINVTFSMQDGILTATVTNNNLFDIAVCIIVEPLNMPFTPSYTFYKNE